MSFLLKLLLMTGKFLIGFIVICAIIVAVIFVVSQGIQFVARIAGYEVGSFFNWAVGGIAKRFGWKRIRRRRVR